MLGLTSYLPTANRVRLVMLAVAATIGLSALVTSSAHASGCTDSWTNTAGGSWFEGSNWSKGKAPTSEEEACITAEGTYTVTMTQTGTSGTVSVKSLTIGGSSGTQTLVVGSSCSLNAVLTTTGGISNGAQGAITLTNGDGCGDGVKLIGPLTNAGSLTIEPEHGGARELQGSLTNTGTLSINTSTAYNGTSAVLTNKGTLNVAEGETLSVSAKNSFTNGSGGKIVTTGSGDVLVEKEASFTEGTGTTSGTKPVIVDDAALGYTGSGKSLIALRGEKSTLSGNLAGSQSLLVESTCSENVIATAAASFTSAGTITLTNGDGCGDNATLTMSAGTLTNSGKLITETAAGGSRTIKGNITNTGTFSINANTAYNGTGTLLTNSGALNIAEVKALTVSEKGSVENLSGNVAAGATGALQMEPGTSFTEGGGTTSGVLPVIVRDAALAYTGTGSSTIAQRGEGGKLSGNLSTGQTLLIESTCSENAKTTANASFTNEGAIKLTNGDTCGDNATLVVSTGTLTNSGKIISETPVGGIRTIQGSIMNTGIGTLSINANTAYNGTSALLTNEGALNIAEGKALTVTEKGSVVNNAGNIAGGPSGALLMEPGTSFTEGPGTTSGALPVIVRDAALTYSGGGSSTIAQRGEGGKLSGNLSTGQTLLIESTCSENAKTTAGESFTNQGTITLTNGDGCGNSATLAVSTGTLTNSGKILSEPDVGGVRQIQGNVTNTGTLSIKADTAYNGASATLTNEGTISIAEGVQLTVTGGGLVTNGSGGTIFAAGSALFFQSGGTFNEGAGKTIGTEPVILDDLALKYSGTTASHGAGRIGLRGASILSGTVRTEESLSIQSSCSENAVVTASSFINNGAIELTNGDGCANSATLNLKEGTLTNNGKLDVEDPHGGGRSIEGSVINANSLSLAAGETLQVSGSYTQTSAARLKEFIASASSFGSLSVSGSATIAGLLVLRQGSFKASLGQKYAILTSASLTGTFAAESEGQINPRASTISRPTRPPG